MTTKTQILSVHPFRRSARAEEQRIQALLDGLDLADYSMTGEMLTRGYPSWMRGVRVEKAGRLSWAVVATDTKGH